MTPEEARTATKFIRKAKDAQSLFVVAALSIALIATAFRLFADPDRPLLAVIVDWAFVSLVVAINTFSVLIVAKAVKSLEDSGEVGAAYDAIMAERKRKQHAE
jgi:hypothetical protein